MPAPPPSPDAPKEAWRAWARRVRAEVVDAAVSGRVVAALRRWPGYLGAGHLLSYLAIGSEVDLSALEADDKRIYVTRTDLGRGRAAVGARLSLHLLERAHLERHGYGFLQPPAGAAEVEPSEIDLVLVPGLVFDRSGARLGYGKGLYDRLLPHFAAGVPVVGVTTEALLVERLPVEPHDRRVSHLLTERGVREAIAP